MTNNSFNFVVHSRKYLRMFSLNFELYLILYFSLSFENDIFGNGINILFCI